VIGIAGFPSWGLACLVIVVGASVLELAIRVVAPRLPAPLDWHAWEAQHKVAAMQELVPMGGASVVGVGSSMMNTSLDANLLTEMLGSGSPVFNAGLNGATMRTIERWTLDVVLPMLKPHLVVLGLQSLELNDGSYGGKRSLKELKKSYGWRRRRTGASGPQRMLLALERRSYLVRYRRFFVEPSIAKRRRLFRLRRFVNDPRYLFRKSRGRFAAVSPLGMLDALRVFKERTYRIPDRIRRVWVEQYLNDFEVGGTELAALRRLVHGVRSSGIPILVVQTPTTPDWTALHPGGEQDFDRFKAALSSAIRELDVPFVDMTPAFSSLEPFADPIHLNQTGWRRFTGIICDQIGNLMSTNESANSR